MACVGPQNCAQQGKGALPAAADESTNQDTVPTYYSAQI